MDKVEHAVRCFRETFSCCQAIVSAYGPEFGLDRGRALKVSAAFGGGIARMGETCGAVTGGLMVIGLAFGRTRVKDRKAGEETRRIAGLFIERFRRRNYTILCRELLGCDMDTPDGRKFFRDHNLRERLCSGFVKDAAELLEILLFPKASAESDGDSSASL